jgi:AraC-like DNA-binding protein
MLETRTRSGVTETLPGTTPEVTSGAQARTTPYGDRGASPNWETLAVACQFRLPELARTCNVSMRTLQRHFRKQYDTTLSEWVRELRLEKARAMLTEAESVKCVAFDLGYKQPSHFSRDFKDRFGVSPSALRFPLALKVQISKGRNGHEI